MRWRQTLRQTLNGLPPPHSGEVRWPLALAGIGLFVGSWAVFGHIARVPTYPPEQLAVKILGRQLRHDFQADFGIIGLPKGNPALLAEGQRIAFRIKADRDCYVGIGTLMAEVK